MPGCMPAVFGRDWQQALGLGDDGVGLDAALFEDGTYDALLLFGQGDQQMQRKHHLAVVLFGQGLGLLQGLLGLLGEFIESKHLVPPMKPRGRPTHRVLACPQNQASCGQAAASQCDYLYRCDI